MSGPSWNDFQPGGRGGVPTSTAAPATSGDPVMNQLIHSITNPYSAADVQAAVTPMVGPHVPSMPNDFTRQIGPHQDAPMDQRRVRGAGNARAQGIGNAITGVTNALGAFVTKEAEVKQGQLKDSATKVIQAQQQIDEAKQQLDIATQNGDAETAAKMQKQISDGEQVRNTIFASKHGKDLQKGFDFSYTDPTANKTEHHAAVLAAIKDAKTMAEKKAAVQKLQAEEANKRGTAMGEAYAKAQPQGLSPNIAAQQKITYAQASQKYAADALKEYTNLKGKIYAADQVVNAAGVRQIGAAMLQGANFKHQEDMLGKRFAQSQQMLGERFKQENSLVYTRAQAARQLANEVFTDRKFDPLTMMTTSEAASSKYQNNYLADQNDVQKLITARDKAYPGGSKRSWYDQSGKFAATDDQDAKTYEGWNIQIRNMEAMRDNDKQMADHYGQLRSRISSAFNLDGGAGASDDSFGSAGNNDESDSNEQSDSTGGDFTNPFNWLNSDE